MSEKKEAKETEAEIKQRLENRREEAREAALKRQQQQQDFFNTHAPQVEGLLSELATRWGGEVQSPEQSVDDIAQDKGEKKRFYLYRKGQGLSLVFWVGPAIALKPNVLPDFTAYENIKQHGRISVVLFTGMFILDWASREGATVGQAQRVTSMDELKARIRQLWEWGALWDRG